MKKTLALAVFVAASGGLAGTSWATPGHQAPTTPTTWSGACNMMVSWPEADLVNTYDVNHGVAVGVQGYTGGMQTAMTTNNPNGDDNMQYKAVANSNGGNAGAC